MKNNIKKTFILTLVMILIITFFSSCKDIHHIDPDTTNADTTKKGEFEYTDSDDLPIELNAIHGGKSIIYYDGYIYIVPRTMQSILWRYNPQTDNMTYVCPDPLCNHKTTDCIFYGIYLYPYIVNNKIFFQQSYTYNASKIQGEYDGYKYTSLKTYDISSGKLTVYEEENVPRTEGSSRGQERTVQLYVQEYRYYYDFTYDEKKNAFTWAICRLNTETKEVIVIDAESETSPNRSVAFLFCIDDRIYFSDLTSIYTTDYNYENKEIIATGSFADQMFTDGSYIYWEKANNEKRETIHRMSIHGGEVTDLRIEARAWNITANYIYYTTNDVVIAGDLKVKGATTNKLTLYAGELRRCAHDGSGDELVWKFEGEYVNARFTEWHVFGNYVYAFYNDWTDANGDGVFTDDEKYQSNDGTNFDIMRINITTKEVYHIKNLFS